MSQKKQYNNNQRQSIFEILGLNVLRDERIGFVLGLLILLASVVMLIAFISYFTSGPADQSLVLDLQDGELRNDGHVFRNTCGSVGALISHQFIACGFGLASFAIPAFFILLGLRLTRAYKNINLLKWFFGLAVLMVWCSVAFAKFLSPLFENAIFNPGGDHGLFICQRIENVIGSPGLIAVLVLVAIAFLSALTSETVIYVRNILDPFRYLKKIPFTITNKEPELALAGAPTESAGEYEEPVAATMTFRGDDLQVDDEPEEKEEPVKPRESGTGRIMIPRRTKGDPTMQVSVGQEDEKAKGNTVGGNNPLGAPINPLEPFTRYKYPTLDLLQQYDNDGKPYIDEEEQKANKNQIVRVLKSFGVEINAIKATVGPTITLYEVTPAEGVRISRIRNLEDDIALSLRALGIRIIAPIPGKGTIGIEVPNAKPNIVSMRSILNSRKFQETKMELPIALGKTITNEVFMVDLAKIPHLLVAGATGQGKSVGLNCIINSLLYKKHPNELKFVLIDPKKVEFNVYAPIADHFMATVDDDDEPIITDVTKVVRTLKSLCMLMDTRYDLLKKAGARNIKEYNRKFVNRQLRLTDGHEYMPYIVVIIDEFGDLIMTAGKEIELPIARIAQLARAVGIHMVIATQRPTTSIITGNIKANFPGRMAFKVSAMIDSRTILDRPGANQLVGRGDMLFLNGNEPVRVQCAFIDTPEVENVNNYIQEQSGPTHPLELPEPAQEESGTGGDFSESGGDNLDPIFAQAAAHVVSTQQGSTSMIQRRFSIGYNRAGRLMDQLEKAGIVGAAQGSKPREVLIQDANSLEILLNKLRSGEV